MPHHPKPFFRPSRSLWYVQVGGKQYNLGPDRDEAFRRYHELMRLPPEKRPIPSSDSALLVLDAFLTWVQQSRAGRTYEWYQRHTQAFAAAIPPTLSVRQLRPFHLTQVLSAHPDWSPATKNGLCRAVQRAFRWAEREGLIDRSPFVSVEKPRSSTREVNIPPQDFDLLLSLTPGDNFRDLLITAWETGARPQEITAVEARHVDLKRGRWVFPVEESKGQRYPRVVYLNDTALAITRRLMVRHPAGPLYRNADGKPWNRFALACAFGRLQVIQGLARMKELGVTVPPLKRFTKAAFVGRAELARARAEHKSRLRERRREIEKLAREHARKHSLYDLRHAWATRALQRGVDPLTAAILLGHTDPSCLCKVYQHLAHDPDFLRHAARKASG
jgi:integrase